MKPTPEQIEAALQGLLANGCYGSCNSAANQAYDYADSMIEARKGNA
jgi:hypothetical protein